MEGQQVQSEQGGLHVDCVEVDAMGLVEERVRPCEVVGRLLVAVAVGLVEHELARAHMGGLVDLPEDRVPLAGVAYAIRA